MRDHRLTSGAGRRKSSSQAVFPVWGAVLLPLILLVLPSEAAGDQILLKNGNRLEGRVEAAAPGKIRIVIDEGQSVVVDLDQVSERIPGSAPIDTFENRFATLDRSDRDSAIELAQWGEAHGVRRSARKVWRVVLNLDPHHAGARNRLGYALPLNGN